MTKAQAVKSVLFICTGNTCRSVMAEGFLKNYLKDDSDIEVRSAGLIPFWSGQANELTVEVMKEADIDVAAHKTSGIDEDLLNRTDLILTMTRLQKENIKAQYKTTSLNLFSLKEYVYNEKDFELMDVADPYGRSKEEYQRVAAEINDAVKALVGILKNE